MAKKTTTKKAAPKPATKPAAKKTATKDVEVKKVVAKKVLPKKPEVHGETPLALQKKTTPAELDQRYKDQPYSRVTDKMLMSLKLKATPEDKLRLLQDAEIRTEIDYALLKRVRFPVDYNTPLRKNGCVVGCFQLVPKHENSQVFFLKKVEKNKAQKGL